MKAKTFVILYWVIIILIITIIELHWFSPEPWFGINETNIWFIGFIGRLLTYIFIALFGCLGLIELLIKYKIK